MKDLVKSNKTEKSEQNYIYSAKDIWELSNSSSRTWDNFVADFLIATDWDQKRDYLEEHASRSGGNKYTEKTLKAFQLWLRKNAINAGGQRTEGSIIKQEIHDIVDNSEYKYTKEEICSICNCSARTFESFAPQVLADRDFISAGSSHKKLYTESVLQKFQLWLLVLV